MEPTEAMKRLDAMMEVMQPPFQVIQAVVDYKWTFAINHFPGELGSDEEPPVRFDDRTDIIQIDGLLGLYTPERQEIKIFRRGIEDVCKRWSMREHDVTLIVRLHEWAHALLHIGLLRGGKAARYR